MGFLYYLLIFFVAVSAIIAILMAVGVLHINVYTDSDLDNFDNLPEDVRTPDKEKGEDKNNNRD